MCIWKNPRRVEISKQMPFFFEEPLAQGDAAFGERREEPPEINPELVLRPLRVVLRRMDVQRGAVAPGQRIVEAVTTNRPLPFIAQVVDDDDDDDIEIIHEGPPVADPDLPGLMEDFRNTETFAYLDNLLREVHSLHQEPQSRVSVAEETPEGPVDVNENVPEEMT